MFKGMRTLYMDGPPRRQREQEQYQLGEAINFLLIGCKDTMAPHLSSCHVAVAFLYSHGAQVRGHVTEYRAAGRMSQRDNFMRQSSDRPEYQVTSIERPIEYCLILLVDIN